MDPNELLKDFRQHGFAEDFQDLDTECKKGNLPVDWAKPFLLGAGGIGAALVNSDKRIKELEAAIFDAETVIAHGPHDSMSREVLKTLRGIIGKS